MACTWSLQKRRSNSGSSSHSRFVPGVVRANFLLGTAHCADMYPARSQDVSDLIEARRLIEMNIAQWLGGEAIATTTTTIGTNTPTTMGNTDSVSQSTQTQLQTQNSTVVTTTTTTVTSLPSTTQSAPGTVLPNAFLLACFAFILCRV